MIQSFIVKVGNARWLFIYSPLANEYFLAGIQL